MFQKKSYHAFMGIPFAAPPIKDLRFLAPQKIEPWDGVLSATKIKPACIQYNTVTHKGKPFGLYGKEDCLYLDIFAPDLNDNKKPVVVFIYSDRFQTSYNKTKDYAPDFFIEEDIIVVTISHRLSIFGFLSFENKNTPGNAGLKDIVAGLEWISKNIRNFGGDPEKVTLLGSQAGGVAVDLLIRSKAHKLFRSAILQSGTALSPTFLQENVRERAFKMGKLLEIPTTNDDKLLQELNEVPAWKLLDEELRTVPDDYYKENQKGILAFGPIVEKDSDGLVTEYPENSSENVNIPIMIGLNSREGFAAALRFLMEPHWLKMVDKDFTFLMPLRMNFQFDPLHDAYYEAIDELKKFYFKGNVTVKSAPEYMTYIGDIKAYGIDKAVQMYSNISSSPVYYYYFDYFSDLNENKVNFLKMAKAEEGTWGAATGDELCYLFRCPNLNEQYIKYQSTDSEEQKMLMKLIKMWANFIKYGNPTPHEDNPLGDIKWPAYDLKSKQYLHIDKIIKVEKDLWKYRFNFWDQFLKKWEKRAELGLISKKGDEIKNDEL
ncbi:juvenile hormone esterase-like [Bicyclus anynana]|uniref:Juvenile hormone esterase-like n=1 Tax=Bicyclus anynana TaxID=110368 RepID=A0ABM3LXX1_BICAN|nr:juvenile hormone esterase-like [Bicyclus anynana]